MRRQAVFHCPSKRGSATGLMDAWRGYRHYDRQRRMVHCVPTEYDTWINTSEITVRLLSQRTRRTCSPVGTIIRAGSKMCVTSMEVRGSTGRLVATGSGTFIVSKKILH